jgi:uncharacterized membrane protein YfcA
MFTTMFATVLHAVSTQTVDVVLAALLVIGSAVGTQWGVKISQKLRTHHLRVILSLMLLAIALKLSYGLFIEPDDMFVLEVVQ